MKKKGLFTVLAIAAWVILSVGCATTKRSDYDNECDYARAHYDEMQNSVRTYYMLGQTSVAEVAVAERRLKNAKREYEAACNVKISKDADDLFEGVIPPTSAQFMGESNCRENGKRKSFKMNGGTVNDIVLDYKSVLEKNGWFTTSIDDSSKAKGFRATKEGRHLKFQLGGSQDEAMYVHVCVWPVWPKDDNCSENCNN